MADFLLEVGTEEVPASVVVPALEQLGRDLATLLRRERIAFSEVRTVGTPRRLVAYVTDVAFRQEDAVVEHRGPAKGAAFDASGAPTRAAEGFARKHGLAPSELTVRVVEGGEYVFAEKRVEGRDTPEVLGPAVPGLLFGLSFPKFMRWGEGKIRFSRPIRWLVALHGETPVPVAVEGVASGTESWGHRFLPAQNAVEGNRVQVARAEEYFARMEDAQIVVDPAARRQSILDQGNALAAADGSRVVWDEGLLHDVIFTVERPTAFLGRFSEEYLRLPRPVLVSAMRKHQRYFTLETSDGSLAPRFLAYRNGGDHGLDLVREGNERVLIFRFNDAVHHFQEDAKSSLTEKRERLKRIVFMERMGTIWDRSERLERVVRRACELLGQPELAEDAAEAARLCKADLASHMVGEFADLQGVMGREYARAEGVSEAVAEAIADHYLPRSAAEAAPEGLLARVLGLADRLDLLVAAFSLGYVPTGSSDPFGLRRATAGAVTLLRALPANLRLTDLLEAALDSYQGEHYYEAASPRPRAEVLSGLLTFFRPRLEAVLAESGVRGDLSEAVLGAGFESIPEAVERGQFLQSQLGSASWDPIVAVGTRVRNILKPVDVDAALSATADSSDLSRLENPTELRLRDDLAARTAVETGDLAALWAEWETLAPLVDQFFVDVLVNAEDPALRAARLALLRRLDDSFRKLADFSKITAL